MVIEPRRRRLLVAFAFLGIACNRPPRFDHAPARGPKNSTDLGTSPNDCKTLTAGSGRILESLLRPVHVQAYITRGTPELDAFARYLGELLLIYQNVGKGKFVYSITEARSAEQIQAAKDAGLKEIAFVLGNAGDGNTPIRGFMGLAFKYGGQKEVIPILEPTRTDGLEFWITNKIRETRDQADMNRYRFGVISQHQEMKLSDFNLIPRGEKNPSIQRVMEAAFPYYAIEEVDLQKGASAIPKELTGLIVTQPGTDYTDKELRRIDQFLMEGNKSLVVYASAVNLKAGDTSMRAKLSTHGLEKLLAGYGVEMKKDAVLDAPASMRIQVATKAGPSVFLRSAGVVVANHDPRHDDAHRLIDVRFAGFYRADEISFPFPSTLVLHPEKQPEARSRVVARTTENAIADTSETVDLKRVPSCAAESACGQKAIAAAVEGKLRTAMGSGDGIEVSSVSKQESRVLVVSSAQFLANPFASTGPGKVAGALDDDVADDVVAKAYAQKYLVGTILAFKMTLDWMSSDVDLLESITRRCGP